MKLDSAVARKRTAEATSSGRPMRPTGICAATACSTAAEPPVNLSKPAVAIGPGLTALARIRRSASSAVRVRASERTAALVAL